MTICREQTIEASAPYGGAAVPLKCKSWLCEYCQPMRRSQLVAKAAAGRPNRFITVTCRRGQHPTPELAAAALAAAWRRAVQRWRRLSPTNKGEYLCVFEAHKSGWPHLHILWRGSWLSWAWLKDQMTELLNSPSVYIARVPSVRSAAAYVAKYIGKEPHRFGTTKRYWTSRAYEQSKPTDATRVFPEATPTEIRNLPIHYIKADWQRWGRVITEVPPDAITWGTWWRPPDPPPASPRLHLRYVGWMLKSVFRGKVTPVEAL